MRAHVQRRSDARRTNTFSHYKTQGQWLFHPHPQPPLMFLSPCYEHFVLSTVKYLLLYVVAERENNLQT